MKSEEELLKEFKELNANASDNGYTVRQQMQFVARATLCMLQLNYLKLDAPAHAKLKSASSYDDMIKKAKKFGIPFDTIDLTQKHVDGFK